MSKTYREIEIKHGIRNPEEVQANLEKLGAKLTATAEVQEDTYYVPAHRDFLAEDIVSEWLRIRKSAGKSSVNYKLWLPRGAAKATHCDEYETAVDDVTALEHILAALDLKEIVKVHKTRSTWELDGVEVALDTVVGLGSFIELEAKADLDDVEAARSHLQEVLAQLGADTLPQDRRGYPYQLLHREK